MRLSPQDTWLFRRLLAGLEVTCSDLEQASAGARRMLDHLVKQPLLNRLHAWDAVLASLPELGAAEILRQLAEVDQLQPIPGVGELITFATLEDVARMSAETPWLWKGWIPSGRICGLAALEGIGKTRLLLDLCKRVYHADEWPDGQPATLPQGTRSVWLCSDGQQSELAETAAAFGLPLNAITLPAPPGQPFDGTSLDDPDTLAALQHAIETVKPGLLVIDTLTYATQRDLCRQNDLAVLRDPLVQLAQENSLTVLLALHVNSAGQAYGRRIRGLTRTLMHLEQPDPDGQPDRLRFWCEKSYAAKPGALGLTLGPTGNTYDSNPPQRLDAPTTKGGRPASARQKAEEFIVNALTMQNDRKTTDLRYEWEAAKQGGVGIFYAARDGLLASGLICEDCKPQILHLHSNNPDKPGMF